ncbi:MAG: hypothetical protein EBS89_14695, partial [Proteobacteria bacterium]|nr:hypothetical protein [Pseudomonadota bacterium]
SIPLCQPLFLIFGMLSRQPIETLRLNKLLNVFRRQHYVVHAFARIWEVRNFVVNALLQWFFLLRFAGTAGKFRVLCRAICESLP